MSNPVVIGNAELWLGDCREVMASWPECRRFDALIVDPPYGVGLLGKVTKYTMNRPELVYDDSEDSFRGDLLDFITRQVKS